jgi:UDP-glucose:(heptosyl)LPS alpha-1,3-glucosyltransferase
MLPVRRCDVYHPHAGLAAAARLSPMKRLFNPRRARFAAVEHRLLTGDRPPVVLCLSEYVKREVQTHYSLPADKLPVLFNAVDLDHFTPPEQRAFAERPTALMIAQDFERKGVRQTLEAMASLEAAARPRLQVIGRGDVAPYERLARSLNITNDVRFEGSTTDPRPQYRSADYFVLPTRHDPCSLVVLESLAMGLPVISTKFNGATEIMTDGVHGRVLDDPNDTRALAAAMTEMRDATRRREMSAACVALRPRLSYDRHIDRLLEIYRNISPTAAE